MSLSELSSRELSRIDSICLQYEKALKRGIRPDLGELMARYKGDHPDVLLRELELVRDELSAADTSVNHANPSTEINLPSKDSKIGPYVIGDALGRGGMGVVLEALDSRLERKVAIKMLAVNMARQHDLTERFQREARAVAGLSHPNIVELFDIGSFDGVPYAVMEYLDGQLLSDRLQQTDQELPVDEVRGIGAQIADALDTAHRASVIHRDLKPENIMLVRRSGGEIRASAGKSDAQSESTIVKLFDFGLSRAPQNQWNDGVEDTQQGVIMGTPGYMAPEQALGKTVTPAADIFSLGCILFEAFYGRPAFEGDTKFQRHRATLDCQPHADPMRRRADIELADLIDRCLSKEPTQRPPSAAAIATTLRRRVLGDSLPTDVGPQVAVGRFTRRRLLEVVGGGVAGAIAGAAVLGNHRTELQGIRSIAVLSFVDQTSATSAAGDLAAQSVGIPQPLGDAELDQGEKLSALLVHELTRLSEVSVPRFRPLIAETPERLREVAEMLDVDALITGDIRKATTGSKEFVELDVQIISAKTGVELWGKRFVRDSGASLLQQSEFATEIASAIGQRMTSTHEEMAPPSVESFACLVDAKARSDPDSLPGLERALMCFQMAHEEDPSFADAVAGIALTSIILAAEAEPEKSRGYILQAREKAQEAQDLDQYSIDARLAEAMLDWQTTTFSRIEQAEKTFQELAMVAPNNWQVHHQYGLLQLATGRIAEAARSLQQASQLNPLSVTIRVDRARLLWFAGNHQRATNEAVRIRDKYDRNVHARGLLVDIYENLGRLDQAASQHDTFDLEHGASDEDYFAEREHRLSDLPYGPYGPAVNAAILRTRRRQGFNESALADLIDSMPPMLPLVLSAHPSFQAIKELPLAQEFMPS